MGRIKTATYDCPPSPQAISPFSPTSPSSSIKMSLDTSQFSHTWWNTTFLDMVLNEGFIEIPWEDMGPVVVTWPINALLFGILTTLFM